MKNKTKTVIVTAEIDRLELGFEMDHRCTLTVARLHLKRNAQFEALLDGGSSYVSSFTLPSPATNNRAEDLASRIAGLLWMLEKAYLDVTALPGAIVRLRIEISPNNSGRITGVGHVIAERWLSSNSQHYPENSLDWQNALRPYQQP